MSRGPLTEEQSRLAADYVSLAVSLAMRAIKSDPRLGDDILSEAFLSLCTAARDYRRPSPISFAAFARFRICREIGRIRRLERDLRPGRDVRKRFKAHHPRPSREHDEEDILASLPRKCADALRLVYLEGLNQTEAARRMGCSQREVSRLLHLSRELLTWP